MTMDIIKVYEKYFDIIDDYFGSIKQYLGPEEDSHIDLGQLIATYPLISDLIYDATEELGEEIENFWNDNLVQLVEYTKQQNVLKCVYSGDISPVVLENFVKRSALYIDTVILPDPILNLSIYNRQVLSDNKYYLSKLIRHVFNIWKLKELILADTKERIILILPISLDLINPKDRNILLNRADARSVVYLGNVLGRDLGDRESILDYLGQFETSNALYEKIVRFDLLPDEFRKNETLNKFLERFIEAKVHTKLDTHSIGTNFGLYIFSQFVRVQEHKFICDRLIAEPIYDYELPWFFFNYEIGGLGMDASIASALQREKFEWISKVPLPALKILREENKLDYMRGVIRRGITDLKAKTDANLSEVSKQIEKNLKEEFQRQKAELKEIEKKVGSITKKEIPITTGGFLAGFIPNIGIVISLLTAGRDIAKLFKKRKELKIDLLAKKNDFINLLMNSYER
jgi:hypothetical protein